MSIVKKIDHLNLDQIAASGQCFRWKKTDSDTYVIPELRRGNALTSPLTIRNVGDEFELSCSEEDWNSQWYYYFDMDTDYEDVERRIMESSDDHARQAFCEGSGIRILKQDLWEMIVTFIISQNNNIKRITNSVEEIVLRNGGHFPYPGETDPLMFMDKTLGLGYRSPYLRDLFIYASEHPGWLSSLPALSYEEAVLSLKERTGIGPKVANCICLFGLHHVEAFPIDTHVKQLLLKYYPDGFDFDYYRGIAGIIQQYLFYYELNHK